MRTLCHTQQCHDELQQKHIQQKMSSTKEHKEIEARINAKFERKDESNSKFIENVSFLFCLFEIKFAYLLSALFCQNTYQTSCSTETPHIAALFPMQLNQSEMCNGKIDWRKLN